MYEKSSFITQKAMRKFVLAAFLSGFVSSICVTTNALLVGNMMGSNAMSAVSLVMPMIWIMDLVVPLFALGASVQAGRAIGNQDFHASRSHFTAALTSIVGSSLLLMLLGTVLKRPLVNFVCDGQEVLIEQALGFFGTYVFFLPAIYLFQVISTFANIEGHPKVVAHSTVVICLSNVALNLLLIPQLGAQGSALSTGLSNLLGLLILVAFQLHNPAALKPVGRKNYVKGTLHKNVKGGVPVMVPSMAYSVALFVSNIVVLKCSGTSGIFIWSVCVQILAIGHIIYKTPYSTVLSMGSVLVGEQDFSGLRILLKRTLRVLLLIAVPYVLMIEIFPEWIIRLFGGTGELLETAKGPIRIYTLCLLPFFMVRVMSGLYQTLVHPHINVSMSVFQLILMTLTPYLLSLQSPDLIWWGFPIAFGVLVLLDRLLVYIAHTKNRELSYITLIPQSASDPSVNITVRCDDMDFSKSLERMGFFLSICELDPLTENRITICCEEMMGIIVKHNKKIGKTGFFDLHIIQRPNRMQVVIKDAGTPYNPVTNFEGTAVEALEKGEKMHLKMRLINALCKDLSYKFMNGLNVTFMTFPSQQQ